MEDPSNRRVTRLITRLNIGGPARQALLLTKELGPRWPTLLAAGEGSAAEGELVDPDVSVVRVPLVRPPRPFTDLKAIRQVRRLLNLHRPSILHTHMAKAGAVGRTAARGRPIRTVHTFHGHVLAGYFSKPVEKVFLEAERRLAKTTDVLIAISPEIKEDLLALGVGRPDQYEVIPLGFDLTEHLKVSRPSGRLRSRLGLSSDAQLIGAVGRLVPIKNLSMLLRATQLLPGVHLALLGDGDERDSLMRLARSLGLGDRCHFTGWWTDVPSAMSDLDVVALTSLNEGTPVALIEAAACARPTVATDVGGVSFVVQHEQTGLLVPSGDHRAMAVALRSLLDAPQMSTAMGAAGRSFVKDRFHKDRLLADIDALYTELASDSSSSTSR